MVEQKSLSVCQAIPDSQGRTGKDSCPTPPPGIQHKTGGSFEMFQHILPNLSRRVRLCDPCGVHSHLFQQFRLFNHLVEFELYVGKTHRTDRSAILHEVDSVAVLLAGRRIEEDEREM